MVGKWCFYLYILKILHQILEQLTVIRSKDVKASPKKIHALVMSWATHMWLMLSRVIKTYTCGGQWN